jgi:hypothetical protein
MIALLKREDFFCETLKREDVSTLCMCSLVSISINNLVSKLGIMGDVVEFSVFLTAGKSKFLFLVIDATSASN